MEGAPAGLVEQHLGGADLLRMTAQKEVGVERDGLAGDGRRDLGYVRAWCDDLGALLDGIASDGVGVAAYGFLEPDDVHDRLADLCGRRSALDPARG